MVHLMHQRSPDGPLWLIYGCYTYIMCAVGQLYITAFQWYKILHRKLSGPLIISKTAEWSIWCTRDHQTGRFDWYTDVTNIQYRSMAENLHITAFQWYKILNGKLNWPLIISQTARWYIHSLGITGRAYCRPMYWIRKNLNISQCQLGVRIM